MPVDYGISPLSVAFLAQCAANARGHRKQRSATAEAKARDRRRAAKRARRRNRGR